MANTSMKEVSQLTYDGRYLNVYNGVADWLYEEEIFEKSNTIWWSPDSNKLAYLKINNSKVDLYEYSIFDGSPYNFYKAIRYPKLEKPIPDVKVLIYDLNNNRTIELLPPNDLKYELRLNENITHPLNFFY